MRLFSVTSMLIFLIVVIIFVRLVFLFFIVIIIFFCFCLFNCILLTVIHLIHEPLARIHRATLSHVLTLIIN